MAKRSKSKQDRDGGRFLALPHVVLESPGYRQLSYTARALLLDVALQYRPRLNGKLSASRAYLGPLGWCSEDVRTCALRELTAAGLLIQTRCGRINHAAWYALAWFPLEHVTGVEIDPKHYHRGAYMEPAAPPERISHRRRKNTVPTPPGGAMDAPIAPPGGAAASAVAPPGGAVRAGFGVSAAPPGGAYLDKPSAVVVPIKAAGRVRVRRRGGAA
jgi:hypothetical protein